jgi:hypothetical protein
MTLALRPENPDTPTINPKLTKAANNRQALNRFTSEEEFCHRALQGTESASHNTKRQN